MRQEIHQTFDPQLIAPCGMNCAVCSAYLASLNKTPRKIGIAYCDGCRPRNRQCATLKKKCKHRAKMLRGEIEFCFDCSDFPCDRLIHLDKRYKTHYRMSMIENLEKIRDEGVLAFIEWQQKKYACAKCHGLKSTHNDKCFKCDEITNWRK